MPSGPAGPAAACCRRISGRCQEAARRNETVGKRAALPRVLKAGDHRAVNRMIHLPLRRDVLAGMDDADGFVLRTARRVTAGLESGRETDNERDGERAENERETE